MRSKSETNLQRLKDLARENPAVRSLLSPLIIARRIFLKRERIIRNELKLREKDMIHSLGDILAHDPILQLEDFEGVFAIDPRSDLFYRMMVWKSYETKLAELCKKHLDPHKDVIDVGANIGFYTVLFAKKLRQRRVLAIEPTKNALKRLRHNLDINGVSGDVDVFEGAASNHSGTVEIKTIQGKEEYSSLGEMEHPSIAKEEWTLERVESQTLDTLSEEKSLSPGFLKIDVEGAEHLVLEGAQKILTEDRPMILSELSDFLLRKNGSSAQYIVDFIQAHNYKVIDPLEPAAQPGSKKFGDILCVPNEIPFEFRLDDSS